MAGNVGLLLEQFKRDVFQPKGSKNERPNYFYRQPERLRTLADVSSFFTGSGDEIFARILPQLEDLESELLIVTCFWAPSPSRDRLCETLRRVSAKAIRRGLGKIKVVICFSSSSVLQKLFHTASLGGHTYTPMDWHRQLGLPHVKYLKGIDLTVKSIFVRPFSVMHPKFIIMDRKRVWLPSCNVSWETWFEGCVELSGPIVGQFIIFFESFWYPLRPGTTRRLEHTGEGTTETLFLPSPHHISPKFRLFPWQKAADPPSTPLNAFILNLLSNAHSSVYMQTPNVTATPVLNAILSALQRGVNMYIITSERLMILEQLVTAGTTTSRCMKWLRRQYQRLLKASASDLEAGQSIGCLKIEYYTPRPDGGGQEPSQSHLKLTVADDAIVVLGSGNMDRASWYTSQELGVAFFDPTFAEQVRAEVETAMAGRSEVFFDSVEQFRELEH